MGTVSQTLDLFRSYIGIAESGPNKNDTPFNVRFGMVGPKMAWCHMCVSTGLKDSGIDGPWTAWTPSGIDWFKGRRTWTNGTAGIQAGDVIYFYFGNVPDVPTDHVGIVERVDGGVISTIEGNRSDKVGRFTYGFSDHLIVGYGRPIYAGTTGGSGGSVDLVAIRRAIGAAKRVIVRHGTRGDAAFWAQVLLNAKLDGPDLKTDGVFGSSSTAAAARFQRNINTFFNARLLDEDGKVGPNTWFWLDR